MGTREDYPAGAPCWVDTSQPDPAGAARFYSGLFGWQTEDAIASGHTKPDTGSALTRPAAERGDEQQRRDANPALPQCVVTHQG